MIDADALMRDIEQYHLSNGKFQHWIELQPTVDAVPVRHGKWMVTPVYIKCSECGESFMLIPQNYCPNCGARMDGDRDEPTKRL